MTSANGDYILSLLPSGAYTVIFELQPASTPRRARSTVAPTQVVPLEVEMGPAALTETVQVVGRAADVLTETAQVATNFSSDLDLDAADRARHQRRRCMLAPSVHPTGPAGAYSIAGSLSFENLFLVNGVTVNENLRGQAYDLYIEDAIQETTVATAGISAEYGRFGGGVVNIVTKSGGNRFTGSFRDTLNNDKWRKLTPFEQTAANGARRQRPAHRQASCRPTSTPSAARCCAIASGSSPPAGCRSRRAGATPAITEHSVHVHARTASASSSRAPMRSNTNHRFQGAYTKSIRDRSRTTPSTRTCRWTWPASARASCRRTC